MSVVPEPQALMFSDDGSIPNNPRLPTVPLPDTDPVHGAGGPLLSLWRR